MARKGRLRMRCFDRSEPELWLGRGWPRRSRGRRQNSLGNSLIAIFVLLSSFSVEQTGCLRRSEDEITADYDEIDRRDPPLFINNTRTKLVVAAGRTATLECRVRNLGDRAVSWIRKADLHILTLGSTSYTSDPRFTSHHPNASNDWNLKISRTTKADSGIYECQINTEPKRSKPYLLQVVISNARIVGDRDVFVQHGSDINLTCKAKDSPEPPETVVWYKDEARVDTLLARGGISVVTEARRRSSHLLVSKVTKADAGNYTCAPSNAETDSVMVHVIQGADPRANVMAASAASAASLGSRGCGRADGEAQGLIGLIPSEAARRVFERNDLLPRLKLSLLGLGLAGFSNLGLGLYQGGQGVAWR